MSYSIPHIFLDSRSIGYEDYDAGMDGEDQMCSGSERDCSRK